MVDSTRVQRGAHPALPGGSVVPTERVVARIRRHGRFLILPALIFIALSGGVVYGLGMYTEQWQFWTIMGGAAALFLGAVLWPFMTWLNGRTTITSRRVIVRRGFFIRERREVFHSRGYEIATRRGPFQAMNGSSTITLSPGTDRPLVLVDTPGAALVVDTLHHLIETNQVVLGGNSGINTPTGPLPARYLP